MDIHLINGSLAPVRTKEELHLTRNMGLPLKIAAPDQVLLLTHSLSIFFSKVYPVTWQLFLLNHGTTQLEIEPCTAYFMILWSLFMVVVVVDGISRDRVVEGKGR